MKLEFTGRHLDVTSALRSHVEEHFERLNHIFDGKPAKAHVIIEVERGKHRSEIIVKWRNDILMANTSVSDMYQSLSQTIAKIEKQALKLKKKVIDKSHKAKKVSTITLPDTEVKPAPALPKIVSARKYAVKPLTDEEAAMQLEAEVNQFLVFRNAENQRVSVIYKRKDGNYGLIEP